jgi:hypothetical protein
MPVSTQPARVYVRVRNRGLATVDEARLRVFAVPGTSLPPMPVGTAAAILTPPPDDAAWTLVGQASFAVQYSGCSVAGDAAEDHAAIVRLDWPNPPGGIANLLAVVDCDGDPVTAVSGDVDLAVPRDNNLALRRYGDTAVDRQKHVGYPVDGKVRLRQFFSGHLRRRRSNVSNSQPRKIRWPAHPRS